MAILRYERLFTFTILVFKCFIFIPDICYGAISEVHSFQSSLLNERSRSEVLFPSILRKKRSPDEGFRTESEKKDSSCLLQQVNFRDTINSLKNGVRLEETHVFVNETKFNLALAWASGDNLGILLVLTTDSKGFTHESTLWRSTDHGRSWKNWSHAVDNNVFRMNDGLQRNPLNPSKVYLVSYEPFLYVTENGGETWKKSELEKPLDGSPFEVVVDEQLEFHPEMEDYVAVITNSRQLYVTYNNFKTKAESIQQSVHAVKWGSVKAKTEKCLYVTTGEFAHPLFSIGPEILDLQRYDSRSNTWKTILKRVAVFDVQDKFIYASIYKSENPKTAEDDKLMMISSDGGDTWGEAQLPTLTGDRFYSVLDMSEGLIFMHVDNPGDTGHGTLYTSSSDGIVYSESLRNHLFPNYNSIHDFYKVESIRGVYMASQMNEVDKSIHTVITFNRGAEWLNVSRPDGVECKNAEKDGCYLQIHNAYSVHRGVNARPPASSKSANGIILVHGHVASNLQTTPPDVFLSTDGGYHFKKVLTGPHAYEIADSGGLLVAVPISQDVVDIIKFSTDEGNCWHVYKFTNDSIKFTGLLTEPGGKSMTVGIWGYTSDTKKWTVNVIDFNNVVKDECKEDDYEQWVPHSGLKTQKGHEGCLLGQKETYRKLKADSWCRNGYARPAAYSNERCTCIEDDYECDFGFYRPDGSTKCIRQPEIKAEEIDVCKNQHLERLVSVGYRLIPGDVCNPNGGFQPKAEEDDLNKLCGLGDKSVIMSDIAAPKTYTGSYKLVIGSIIAVIVLLVAVVGAVFAYKLVLLRRHKVVYRYSALNTTDERDNDYENALVSHDTLYRESSDDEVEQENQSPQRNGKGPVKEKPDIRSFHDDSDDDMLG
ncbi:sortilin-like [Physella acuta]|uniref:sortilin-like n=1 Tax=Physella acuta TaxID=109671 RepID=UPI0027DC6570|nr:sortilin-like [Physella acuta]